MMNSNSYLVDSGKSLIIRFPKQVTNTEFEAILKETYRKTFTQRIKQVTFDFSRSTWFGILELSIISLWMLDLSGKKKLLKFNLPEEKQLQRFLATYKFEAFLENNGFQKENDGKNTTSAASSSIIRAPFYPLTFFHETSFTEILDDLNFGNRLETVLGDIKETEIVKSGAIRDIVLKELIDNLRIHAFETKSNIIMTKFDSSTLTNASNFEKAFFNKLRGKAYLTLIISDKGKGIHKTLIDAYKSDQILPYKSEISDQVIVEYSTLSHSTSRDLEQRIGEIIQLLSSKEKGFSPETGLFRLKEIVREFSGLLYIRSGTAIVCYDFLSDPLCEIPRSNLDFKEWKNITDIGGTQFKLLFPVSPVEKEIKFASQFSFKNSAVKRNYFYLPIKQFLPNNLPLKFDQEAKIIQQFSDEFERLALKYPKITIIVDFDGTNKLSSKAIHFILLKALQRQTENILALAINVGGYRKLSAGMVSDNRNRQFNFRPLTLINDYQVVGFLGLTKDKSDLIVSILADSTPLTLETEKLLKKYNNLFEQDLYTNKFQFTHSIQEITQFVKNKQRKQLEKEINDQLIFHKEIKVFLPSKVYCEGYFEVRRLFENTLTFNSIVSWFSSWLSDTKPNFVISVSEPIGKIVDLAIEFIRKTTGEQISHVKIDTPVREVDLVSLVFKLDKDDKAVIFCEVVGSGNTLKAIIEHLSLADIISVFTLVDASPKTKVESNINKHTQIKAILKHPLTYFTDLPSTWKYQDIYQVDQVTHLLVPPDLPVDSEVDGPLWKIISSSFVNISNELVQSYSNSFFNDCVIPHKAVYEGHFSNGTNHLIYFFNIPRLVENFGPEITGIIEKTVKSEIVGDSKDNKFLVTHIVYPSKNPGLEALANAISKNFKYSEVLPIGSLVLNSKFDVVEHDPKMKQVILIDDAVSTGETIHKLYDFLERKGATHIFAFSLLSRGTPYTLRKFEKLRMYGNAKIFARYLADAGIPTYSSIDCPICNRSRELEKISHKFQDDIFSDFIEREIRKLDFTSV